ncbi:hypothetical protein ABFA07_012432 [Porites harrisoni]
MFKVEGRILCPIPQKTPLNKSATLPPPTVEISSTTDLPPGPTTAQAENITTGTPAVVTNTSSPIPKQNSSNQSVTSGPETVKITSITGLPPSLASNKANSIKTDTPAKVTAEVCLVACLTSFRKGVCSQSSHEISLPVCRIYLPHLKKMVLKRFKKKYG